MAMQDDTDEPVELVLTLTPQTLAVLGTLAGPEALHLDETPESLAVLWLRRWARRWNKHLDYYDRYGPGTETMAVAVDHDLWCALREHGSNHGWQADEVASAVLNDSGGRMASSDICDTME